MFTYLLNLSCLLQAYCRLSITKLFVSRQFFETYDVINCGSGWRKGVVNLCLEFGSDSGEGPQLQFTTSSMRSGKPIIMRCSDVSPKLQALVYDILPSTAAVFSYAIGSRRLSANEQFFCWCSNSGRFVTNNSNKTRRVIYSRQQSLHQHE